MWKICFVLATLVVVGSQGSTNNTDCLEKELTRSSLDLAKDAIDKAANLFPNCGNATSECGEKESAQAYLQIAKNLISEANYTSHPPPKCDYEDHYPTDCSDVLNLGHSTNGVYKVWPKSLHSNAPVQVYCDMKTDGGGWTLIQRRSNLLTTQNFYQDWKTYKQGFGNITGEFWLGNENLFILSNQGRYALRFDLRDFQENKRYAVYKYFWIENEDALYKLHISNYSGDAGDGMDKQNGFGFSTKDRDDLINCSLKRGVGWWMNDCTNSNINGIPDKNANKTNRKNLYWYRWKEYESLAGAEMKIRRIY